MVQYLGSEVKRVCAGGDTEVGGKLCVCPPLEK